MRAEQETAPAMKAQALDGVVADFKALRDVTALAARVADMLKDKDIKKALSQEEKNDYTEARLLNELIELEQSLASDERHTLSLLRLRSMLTDMYTAANKADDTPERQQARRVLRAIQSGASARTQDMDYLKLLQDVRLPGSGRGGH